MAKLYGLQAAADHVQVKSKQTVANWIKAGLACEVVTIGNLSVTVFESEALEQFRDNAKHKPGPRPRQP